MFGIDSATPRLFWLLEGESKRLACPADAIDDSVFDLPSIRLASLVGDGAAEFGCEVEGRHSEKREERSRARVLGRAVVVVALLEGLEVLDDEGAFLELVDEADRNKDGKIDFEEWETMGGYLPLLLSAPSC